MKKSLAIDCSKLNTNYQTGTHRFLTGFLEELVKIDNFDFYFYFNKIPQNINSFEFLSKGNIKTLNYPILYTQLGLLNELNKYDYFLFPWQTMPFLGFFSTCQKISIFHDTGFTFKTKFITFLTQIFTDKLVSVSTYTAKKLIRSSTVIGEGVDLRVFYPIEPNKLRKEISKLDIPNFCILSWGRVEERKNVYNNIRAFSKIVSFYPNLKYLFITNFIEDEKIIYSLLKELKLKDTQVIFKKNVSDYELNIYLNCMEFLVFTSLEEGFGLPVLESYAVNKPVILSKIEPLAEFNLSAKQCVDPKNIEDIAEKMIIFLQKKHGIDSKKSFKPILERFSWKKSVATFFKTITNR